MVSRRIPYRIGIRETDYSPKIDFMRFGVLVALVILAGAFIFWKDISMLGNSPKKGVKEKSSEKTEKTTPGVQIGNRWDLPEDLKEVSGIAWMDADRFACVQDEQGTVFIYNRTAKRIERKVDFAGVGDYEGLALNGRTAYVVRSDGRLYEVDLDGGRSSVKEYETALTAAHNVEGLCYDKNNNRLLLAIKGDEPNSSDYKGIYSFDLATKKFIEEPVIRIDLNHELLKSSGKKNKPLMPSAIGIHPKSGDFYITDGPKSNLVLMTPSGEISKLIPLGNSFAQPEGISFSPEGQLFISNEGTKQPGNILQVEIE
jgi:uncharacterized protein YjiK